MFHKYQSQMSNIHTKDVTIFGNTQIGPCLNCQQGFRIIMSMDTTEWAVQSCDKLLRTIR